MSLVTLAVPSLEEARDFYVHGLGWQAVVDEQDVIMLPVAPGVLLSLWDVASFREEVGEPGTGLPPITLAHNVASDAEVDAVLERARAAGAREVREAQRRDWGGYSGYVVDPAGYAWEIAHAPGDAAAAAVARNREFARSLAAPRHDR